MNILFVENHAIFANTVAELFLAEHRVDTAPSLAEAMSLLSSTSYEFALLDYDLDDGKGDEIALHITEHYPNVTIIAVSAHDVGNQAILDVGAKATCPKLEFKHIADLIRELSY